MAIEPDLVGTVSLTSGSTAFTWSGPSLTAEGVQEGDTIFLPVKGGLQAVIASVTSPTAGAITNVAPASIAGAAQPARIRFQSDLARVNARVSQLVELLGGGNLQSLAGLDGVGGDKGITLSGPATFETFTQTALGRALAGLTGANGRVPVATGANTAVMRNIVGMVSQLAGAPNGDFFERFSNANGHYFRTAGGFQVCLRQATVDLTTFTPQAFACAAAFNPSWHVPFGGPQAGFVTGDIPALGNLIIDTTTANAWRVRVTGSTGVSSAAPLLLGSVGFWHA